MSPATVSCNLISLRGYLLQTRAIRDREELPLATTHALQNRQEFSVAVRSNFRTFIKRRGSEKTSHYKAFFCVFMEKIIETKSAIKTSDTNTAITQRL